MISEFCKKSVLTAIFISAIIPITLGQTWEIYDENYTLIRKIENDKIKVLGNAVRVSTKDSTLKLLSKSYEPILSINNAEVFQYLEPWIIITAKGKFGAYHEYGEEIFPTEYDVIETYYNLLLARKGIAYYLYDRGQKTKKALGSYESAHIAQNGQIIATNAQGYYLPLSENPNYSYESLESINGNVILSKEATGYGLINRDGNNILDPVIDEISYLGDSFFFAKNGKEYMLIKAKTNKAHIRYTSYHKITFEKDVILEYIHGKLRRVMKKDGILLDAVGMETVIKTGKNHYSISFRDGRIGLLNDKGNWDVSPTKSIQKLFPGNEGLYGALIDGKYGFVDRTGKLRIANRYEQIGKFSEGLAPVKIGDQWGYIDQNDKISIQPHFTEAGDFMRGVALVKKDGKANLIDKAGKELLSDYYERISFTDDNYYLTENNSLFGLANSLGTEISIPKFDELRREGYDKILIRRGDKYGVMKETGEYSLPIYYSNIIFDHGNDKILAEEEPVLPVLVEEDSTKKNKKKGV
ncbi:MAG: WG repeat-containing protein [Anditalea sp.]